MMIRKLLIANRGEIACRITRTCRELGIATVAVYSDADADALHVEVADEAVHLGGSTASESYLNQAAILEAAARAGADAIHPGYGFLAENATFAQAVIDAGLTWIGPTPESIAQMGDKRAAKNLLEGIPYVPGYTGDDQSDEALTDAANEVGFPLMVKAAAGGGGKGMRRVDAADALPDALAAARREAQQAFGDDTLMLEKLLLRPRHIEVQIFGDQYGNVVALGERECSIQRRHQKIIEESPAYGLDEDLRQEMHRTAVEVGRQLGYVGAGTVEMLLDEDGQFYFIEMNTRLQVEHPVTEMVYSIDLVRWQITIAEGTSLEELMMPLIDLDDFGMMQVGHAIEARIYAEDPANGFLPATGNILRWQVPDTVRVDDGVRSGDTVTPYYDPMLAKVIAHGEDRATAIRKLDHALAKLVFLGMRHNVAFLRRTLTHPGHLNGAISTAFIDEHPELLETATTLPDIVPIAAALAKSDGATNWRNNPNRPVRQTFMVGDEPVIVQLETGRDGLTADVGGRVCVLQFTHESEDRWVVTCDGHRQRMTVVIEGADVWVHSTQHGIFRLVWIDPLPLPDRADAIQGSLRAPMPGQVTQVLVEAGQMVNSGDLLMVMEAMKMEHRIIAPYAGTIEAVRYAVGATVQQDDVLLALIPADET